MKMKKIEMNFGQLVDLNRKIVEGKVEQLVVSQELIDAIKEKMYAVTRRKNKADVTYDKNQMPELHWRINKGWTCMTATAKLMGDVLVITRTNGDTNEKTQWFCKIEGYVAPAPTPEPEEQKEVEFKPELTAIDTRQSKSAKMIVENTLAGDKILDYGCGTGRNMRYIQENLKETNVEIMGCDIADQLKHNKEKHDNVRAMGMQILEDTQIPKNNFNIVLNSHVLNVIESDEIKQAVVNNIYDALVDGGRALIEVRTKKDVEGAKSKVAHGDGLKIKCKGEYTYQEGITKEKMVQLVTNAGFTIEEHTCNSSTHLIIVQKLEKRIAVA